MKQPHAIVADDIRNVGSESPHCARDAIEFSDAEFIDTHFRRGVRSTLCRRLENDLSIPIGSLAFIDEVRSERGVKPNIAMSSNPMGVTRSGSQPRKYAIKSAA
jgi:hypothetical protein